MKISSGALRQIIREEYRRVLEESEGAPERHRRPMSPPRMMRRRPRFCSDLRIENLVWDVVYSDPDLGTQQGEILFDFSFVDPDGKPVSGSEKLTLTSFLFPSKDDLIERFKSVLEDLNYEKGGPTINFAPGDDLYVYKDSVADAELEKMIDSIEAADREYNELASWSRGY
jgi:hypothetical protein